MKADILSKDYWAWRFQEFCSRHTSVDGDGDIIGVGPASYALADEIVSTVKHACSTADHFDLENDALLAEIERRKADEAMNAARIDELKEANERLSMEVWAMKESKDFDAELTHNVRERAKYLTGGNCTFADDDLRVLVHLASRAIDADLLDGMNPQMAAKTRETRAARALPSDGGEHE